MTRDQLQEVISEPLADLCARYNDKDGRSVYDHFIDVMMAVVETAQDDAEEQFAAMLPIYEAEAAIKALEALLTTEDEDLITDEAGNHGVYVPDIQAQIGRLRGEGNL